MVLSLTQPGNPPPGLSPSPAATQTAASPNAGVIAGATVAACITLLALLGALYWYLGRRRIRLKALVAEPLPLSATNLSAITSRPPVEARPSIAITISAPSHPASPEIPPLKAEYRGDTIPSVVSGSGSSGIMSSFGGGGGGGGARNRTPTIYSSPQSQTATSAPLPRPPSSQPLPPPPSYAAASRDLQVHEERYNEE